MFLSWRAGRYQAGRLIALTKLTFTGLSQEGEWDHALMRILPANWDSYIRARSNGRRSSDSNRSGLCLRLEPYLR